MLLVNEMKNMKPSQIFEGENSSLRKAYDRAVGTTCIDCGEQMTNVIDPITGKKSKYMWKCEKCHPNLIVSIG
jgi:hypothetical protein